MLQSPEKPATPSAAATPAAEAKPPASTPAAKPPTTAAAASEIQSVMDDIEKELELDLENVKIEDIDTSVS